MVCVILLKVHTGLNMLARDTPTTVRHQDEMLTTTAVAPWVPYGTWQCMESFGCSVVLYALYAGTWRPWKSLSHVMTCLEEIWISMRSHFVMQLWFPMITYNMFLFTFNLFCDGFLDSIHFYVKFFWFQFWYIYVFFLSRLDFVFSVSEFLLPGLS